MDALARAAALLPGYYRQALRAGAAGVEEIRLRCGRAPTLLCGGMERPFSERLCRREDLLHVLEKASGASLHTVADELRGGWLSAQGLRIGVCGRMLSGGRGGFQSFSSLALRIPRECRGIGKELLPALRENASGGTLILSAPGGGKTTLLREMIRRLSDGGLRIGVVDERCELTGAVDGAAGFDLGCRSDVLTGVPKAEGAMLLLRSLNPRLVAMDEITRPEDLEAVIELAGCGVGILATAHAADPEGMRLRPLYRQLLDAGIFQRAVCIEGQGSARRYALRELRA